MTSKSDTYHIEWYSEVPRSISKQTVIGLIVLVAAFGGFGLWAFTAPLAAAVISQGSFVATGQNKIVQHLEGGVIQEIMVREGDNVEEGQTIVRLDETAALANERQLFLRRARLEAINARLLAQYNERDELVFPELLHQQVENEEIASIIESQSISFQSSRNKLESDLRLLKSNIRSLEFRAEGYDLQRESMIQQAELLEGELEGKLVLLEKGYIRKVEVNAIRRAIADANGQIGRLQAEVKETQSQVEKFRQQIDQVRAGYREAAVDELQAIEAELDSVREQSRNAENILRRTLIKAPVSGTVVKMHYHTPGGVVESGKSIAEIIPTDVPLIIEAHVSRTDIDSVRIGQPAVVRLTALNQRITPVLSGNVDYLSADSVPDKSGQVPQEVYVARVSLDASEILRVPGFSPTPGMPAEIMIQTAERTFFDYISQPVIDSMARAFREQ
ncbi:HlyD family type I secretion periplasmic adaptor subunit [Nitratireductor sp. XY-223]|uniref:HlyD family type I secretion periplasmic adaptor subunit n=1 Tax=Nitratireductor sp. XY-223 TaxID=2561926 RepID=UPI0010A9A0F7|nr:HlyD family type I secretion periplasmic adaptor subunit [Nitratireductor sp. XY-223]